MATLNWNPQVVHFQNAIVNAWVARSPRSDVLEFEMNSALAGFVKDEILFLRYPLLIVGEVIGHTPRGKPMYRTTSPDIELWKLSGIGSFNSIRFAKAVFDAPEERYFREGNGSLEAVISMLAECFAEGEFKMNHVNSALLSFILTKQNTKVTRKQHALLDRLNDRFFTTDSSGKHMKSVYMSAPHCFAVGAV